MLIQENTIEAEDDGDGGDADGAGAGDMMGMMMMAVMISNQSIHSAALTEDHILVAL